MLFDPHRDLTLNARIAPKVEEIRSMIRDGLIPKVRVVLCNNGASWNEDAQTWINDLTKKHPDRIEVQHFNHDSIVQVLQKTKPVNASIQLSGQLIAENMNHMRVLVGRVAASQIAALFDLHGYGLLERNIRRYLGLHGNRVNTAIHNTLCSDKADQFYFYNNGVTVVCDRFSYMLGLV